MKLANVLAKYLTSNKELNLPGLGTFHASNAYDPEVDYGKKGASLLNITFEQTKVTALDENLVDFVSKETGKMKVLSKSDLESQLDSVIDFLNTGKPYFLQGIGTLTKKTDGSFEFHKEKFHHTEKSRPVPITEKNSVPQTYIDETRKPRKTKPALIILTLCLLAIVATIWFYIKNEEQNTSQVEDVTAVATTAADTSQAVKDISHTTAATRTAPDAYKYILEIAREPRASKRYNQLKKINWPVEIKSADSVNYTLYIQLPAAQADTARIKDSLSALSGRKVWIER
ncbi:MAG: hypothetical protein QM640_00630 [Niabella sp.]